VHRSRLWWFPHFPRLPAVTSSLSRFSRYNDKRRVWASSKSLCHCFKAQFEHAINCIWAFQALCTPLWRSFLFPQLIYLKPRLRRFSRSWITIRSFPWISEWSWFQAMPPLNCCTWSKCSNCFPPSHHLMLSFPFIHHFISLIGAIFKASEKTFLIIRAPVLSSDSNQCSLETKS